MEVAGEVGVERREWRGGIPGFVVTVEVERERVLEVESAEVGRRDESETLNDGRCRLAVEESVILPALDVIAQDEIGDPEAVRERSDGEQRVRSGRAYPALVGLGDFARPPRADVEHDQSKVPGSLRSERGKHGFAVDRGDVE